MKKGQFMIISTLIASLITISLATTITEIQTERHDVGESSIHINRLESEIGEITADGDISQKEKRNFRKLLGYIDHYETDATFNEVEPCISVQMKSTDRRIQTDCIS